MTSEEYKKAVDFWKAKECKEMLSVRCTPLEYSYHDGCFGIFTESGEKFIGLEKNKNVSLAVFEKIHILVS